MMKNNIMFNTSIHMIAKVLLIIGCLSYLFLPSNTNTLTLIVKKYPYLSTTICILIGLSALYFIFDRDYYLPFLGNTVIPITNNVSSTPTTTPIEKNEASVKVNLTNVPPNSRVIYWAAQKGDTAFDNPIKAYGTYSNMGVSTTDNKGNLIISINCPAEYKIQKFGFTSKLKRHIHYRYEIPNSPGMFSKVYTQYIKC